MKHITYLSALAMSMLCATPLAQADEAFKVTTIQNGQFAPNTTWYTLTIGGNRVSVTRELPTSPWAVLPTRDSKTNGA